MTVRVDIVESIYSAEEEAAVQMHRPHLGASQIGRECLREIYLGFRWAKSPTFSGRMLRLFDRGQDEEERLVSALKKAGMEVWDCDPNTGDQFKANILPHFGGSLDGIGKYNGKTYLLEFKTHSYKSFLKLVGMTQKAYGESQDFSNGSVQDAKPEHYIQMQSYMGAYNLDSALYMAVNKNDDAIYIEEVEFNETVYRGIKEKAKRIISGWSVPGVNYSLEDRISPCKYCDYRGICHGDTKPEKNCRTCKHIRPLEDGTWGCNYHSKVVETKEQRIGCNDYEVFNI